MFIFYKRYVTNGTAIGSFFLVEKMCRFVVDKSRIYVDDEESVIDKKPYSHKDWQKI